MDGRKSKGLWLFTMVAIALAAACCSPPAIPAPYVAEEFAICTNPGLQIEPAISGDIVVWKEPFARGFARCMDKNVVPIDVEKVAFIAPYLQILGSFSYGWHGTLPR